MFTSILNGKIFSFSPKSCTYGCGLQIYWNVEKSENWEVFTKTKYIHSTLFPKLRNILINLEMKISLTCSKIAMERSLTDSLFNLTPDVLNKLLDKSKQYDINPEVEKVLDIIWKNSKIFYPKIRQKYEKNIKQTNIITPETWKDVLHGIQ